MKKLSIKIFLLCLAMLAFTTQANTLFKEQDKQKHIITETVITSTAVFTFKDSEHPYLYPVLVGTVVGVGKELYDSRSGGTGFNNKDLLADSIGISAGLLLGNTFTTIVYKKGFAGLYLHKKF